jgi:hypothetical protein
MPLPRATTRETFSLFRPIGTGWRRRCSRWIYVLITIVLQLSPSDTVVMMAPMPAAEALAPLDEVPGLLQRERGDSDPSTYFAVPGTPISPYD